MKDIQTCTFSWVFFVPKLRYSLIEWNLLFKIRFCLKSSNRPKSVNNKKKDKNVYVFFFFAWLHFYIPGKKKQIA